MSISAVDEAKRVFRELVVGHPPAEVRGTFEKQFNAEDTRQNALYAAEHIKKSVLDLIFPTARKEGEPEITIELKDCHFGDIFRFEEDVLRKPKAEYEKDAFKRKKQEQKKAVMDVLPIRMPISTLLDDDWWCQFHPYIYTYIRYEREIVNVWPSACGNNTEAKTLLEHYFSCGCERCHAASAQAHCSVVAGKVTGTLQALLEKLPAPTARAEPEYLTETEIAYQIPRWVDNEKYRTPEKSFREAMKTKQVKRIFEPGEKIPRRRGFTYRWRVTPELLDKIEALKALYP